MLLTVVIFILILGLLILVHEFGHFIVAKRCGMKVEEFGFFYPPRLFKIKWKGTVYSFNLIPLGGFVKIKGEDGGKRREPGSFSAQPIWQRALTLAAGVSMNFILAVLLISVGYKVGLPSIVDDQNKDFVRDPRVQIIDVVPDSPAANSGLEIGDVIRKINDREIKETKEVQEEVKNFLGQKVVLEIERGKSTISVVTVPRLEVPEGEGPIGIGLVKTGIASYPLFRAIREGAVDAFYSVKMIVTVLYDLIVGLIVSGEMSVDVSGPVGVAVMTGKVARLGWVYVMQFTALLSINLAIINILPFPALDGGRLLFLGIEAIIRRPLNQKVEQWANTVGFALLIALMVMVTFRDVANFGLVEKIKQFF